MEIIKEYPLGQLFGNPHESIDFAILSSDEIFQLISNQINGDVHQFHKHDFYVIFWLEEGKLVQNLDHKIYRLPKGDIFVVCPGQVHDNDFEDSHQDISGGAILFTAKFINQPT